jgi:Family of unknown function (DUF5681)
VNNDDDLQDQEKDLEKRSEMPEPDNAVGFCRPPGSTRFKKGVSGNPRGRPKGRLNVATVFMKTLREKVVINEHGQRKTVTKLEAAFKQLVNKAAGGDLRAIAQLRDLAHEAEEKQKTTAIQQGSAVDELDREVMQGILQRFQQENDEVSRPDEGSQPEEAQDGDRQ